MHGGDVPRDQRGRLDRRVAAVPRRQAGHGRRCCPPAGAGGCALPAAAALRAITASLAPRGRASWPAGACSQDAVALPKVNLGSQVSMKGLLSRPRHGRRVQPGRRLHRAVAAGVLHRPGASRRPPCGSARRARWPAPRPPSAWTPTAARLPRPAGRVRPSLPAAGDRHRDRGAALPGPGGQPAAH